MSEGGACAKDGGVQKAGRAQGTRACRGRGVAEDERAQKAGRAQRTGRAEGGA